MKDTELQKKAAQAASEAEKKHSLAWRSFFNGYLKGYNSKVCKCKPKSDQIINKERNKN